MSPHLYFRRDARVDPHWFCLTCGSTFGHRRELVAHAAGRDRDGGRYL